MPDFNIQFYKDNTHISNSFLIEDCHTMYCLIQHWRKMRSEDYAINKRNIFSMVAEWRAHNLLYKLHYKRTRTKDVDLDMNEKWYRKIGYFILSILYF